MAFALGRRALLNPESFRWARCVETGQIPCERLTADVGEGITSLGTTSLLRPNRFEVQGESAQNLAFTLMQIASKRMTNDFVGVKLPE